LAGYYPTILYASTSCQIAKECQLLSRISILLLGIRIALFRELRLGEIFLFKVFH